MIRSLDDAWKWYEAVRSLALLMKKLAGKWDDPAIQAAVGRENRLRDLGAADLVDKANTILADLDDLSVLVHFSVFEAAVRSRAMAGVDRETATMRHPAVLSALKTLKESIENGSFGKVTEAYKAMDSDLTAQVNQVRTFRNWVAHGRRERPVNNIDPERAVERLRHYLVRLADVESAGTALLPPDGPPGRTEPEPPRPPEAQ